MILAVAASALIGLTATVPADTLGESESSVTFVGICAASDSAERPLPLYGSSARGPQAGRPTGQNVGIWAEVPTDWLGRRVWVQAVDHRGNVGERSNVCVLIAGPTVYALGVPGDTTQAIPFRADPDSMLDTFGGDGSLSASWATSGGCSRTAGHATIAPDGWARWAARDFGPLQQTWVTIRSLDGQRQQGLLLKVQPDESRLEVDVEPGRLYVNGKAGGTWRDYGSLPVSFTAGDVLAARADGSGRVWAWKNGALIGQWNVSAWPYAAAGGQVGIHGWAADGGQVWLDDFGAGTWAPAPLDPLATRDTMVVSALGRDRDGLEVRWTVASPDPSVRVAGFSYRWPDTPNAASWPGAPAAMHLEHATERVRDDLIRSYGYYCVRGARQRMEP